MDTFIIVTSLKILKLCKLDPTICYRPPPAILHSYKRVGYIDKWVIWNKYGFLWSI